MQDEYGLSPDDCVLQKTPFSFDVSVWEFFWPLLAGARIVLARPGGHRESDYLVNLIAAQQITTLHFVPSMLRAFLEEPDVSHCTSLRRVICSGEALPLELEEKFFEKLTAELHNLYGPTEAAVDVTSWQCAPQSALPRVPIGRPIANTQIYIVDERLRPVPTGVPGELLIGGAGVGRGYHNAPALTAQKFIPDQFSKEPGARLYRTGDLAKYRSDGVIAFLGRIDTQVKIRGFRIRARRGRRDASQKRSCSRLCDYGAAGSRDHTPRRVCRLRLRGAVRGDAARRSAKNLAGLYGAVGIRRVAVTSAAAQR